MTAKKTSAAKVEKLTVPAPQAEPSVSGTDSGEKQSPKPALPGFLKSYTKSYPAEKVFHVTSDKQVFLDKDYSLAKAHQNSLGKGEITTYNI